MCVSMRTFKLYTLHKPVLQFINSHTNMETSGSKHYEYATITSISE